MHAAASRGHVDRRLRARGSRPERRGNHASPFTASAMPRSPAGPATTLPRTSKPGLPHRHGADGWFASLEPVGQPPARERRVEHARQLRRPADRLPAARRTPRLDRRHPGVRPDGRFLYDCTGMLASWLQGRRCRTAPRRHGPLVRPVHPAAPRVDPVRPGAVWGDVAVLDALDLYAHLGDRHCSRDQYASAKAWVDLIDGWLAGHLWDNGFQLGDWLDPTAPPEDPGPRDGPHTSWPRPTSPVDPHPVRDRQVLGPRGGAARYADARSRGLASIRSGVRLPSGAVTNDTQTAYTLAIGSSSSRARRRSWPGGDSPSSSPSRTTASPPGSSGRRWCARH